MGHQHVEGVGDGVERGRAGSRAHYVVGVGVTEDERAHSGEHGEPERREPSPVTVADAGIQQPVQRDFMSLT